MVFEENECIWCGTIFETAEEHDKHYLECANENHIVPDEDEVLGIINNPNNY